MRSKFVKSNTHTTIYIIICLWVVGCVGVKRNVEFILNLSKATHTHTHTRTHTHTHTHTHTNTNTHINVCIVFDTL
jgi:hypothetical protein